MSAHKASPHNAPVQKVWKHGEHPLKHLSHPQVTHVDRATIRGWADTMESNWGLSEGYKLKLGQLHRADPSHKHEFEGDRPGIDTHEYVVNDFGDEHFTLSREST